MHALKLPDPGWRRIPWTACIPLLVLLALLGAVGMVQPSFISPENLGLLAGESSVILLLATAQTLVIMLGGIDVSVAALAALASVLIALALPSSGWVGLLGVLGLTTLLGAFQGFVHVRAKIPSIVVTLAGLGMWSGLALVIAGTTVPVVAGYGTVAWLEGRSFGVHHSFAFAMAALALVAIAQHRMPFGRRIRAIGLNPAAARLSGIRIQRVKVVAFGMTGLFSGLAAMTMVARTASGSPTIADSLLLPSIAAVLIGGTAITGGKGGVWRTLVGVLTVTVLRVGIAATGLSAAYEPIAYGVLVVVAAALVVDRTARSSVK